MPAKDVLDLQVSVADLHDADRRFDPVLTGLGFERADTVADHVPVGQIDDLAGWSKRLWWRSAAPGRAVNLHVRLVGSPNDRLALLFRDWFRSHPAGVPAYGECKTRLAGLTGDAGRYAEAKDPVVDLVVSVAEEWAASEWWHS